MKIHGIDDSGKVTEYSHSPVSEEKELEDYIEKNPEIIEKGLMTLSRQQATGGNHFIDLMGLDYDGNVVIVEIKKESNDARKVITQIIEYGIWAEDLRYSDLNTIARENNKLGEFRNLEQMFQERIEDMEVDDFNADTKLYIVHEKIGDDIKKIAQWLNSKGINIYCVELNFHEKDGHKIAIKHDVVGRVKVNVNKKEDFSEEFHTRRGNPDTKEMYTLLREKVSDFGKDVDVVPVKNYVGFKRNQRFLSVRVRREKLILAIRQIYNGKECFTDENDITKVHGRHKNWRESHIKTPDELEPLLVFIRQSYDANKK
jgi:predicted transport protein